MLSLLARIAWEVVDPPHKYNEHCTVSRTIPGPMTNSLACQVSVIRQDQHTNAHHSQPTDAAVESLHTHFYALLIEE